MRKLLLIVVITLLALARSVSHAQTANAQLTGTVAYRERIALPSDAVIDVQLLNTSIADVAAQTVAEVLINAEGQQVPVPFTLTYDPAKIEPAHRYSMRATIRSGDGMLMFSSTQAYPVLTHGAPSKVNLILHTVGHGAKTGTSAKKAPAPAASEAANTAPQPANETPRASEPAASREGPEKSAGPPETKASQPEPPALPAASASPEAPSAQTAPATESASAAAAPQPEPTPADAAPSTGKPASGVTAPESAPTPAETAPPVLAEAQQQAPPAEGSTTAASPESESSPRESKSAESQPAVPEQTTPPESKTERTTPAPETKATEPEGQLPEAPSASKRAELAAAAPEAAGTASEPEGESSSRPERPAPNKALTPLADTQWKLIQLAGQDVVITLPQKPVTLAFSPEGRRIAGSAGCNSYIGTFTDDHGRLHLNPGNMTMMACADPAGRRERKFVEILRSADGYKMSGDVLLLTSNGKTVAKFRNNQE